MLSILLLLRSGLLPDDRLRHFERGVRRRYAAVDGGLQQHLLDLGRSQPVAQRRPGVEGEFVEAARLDGANAFTIYWKIILPLLKPAIATVVIIKGITVYNDFYIPFLYMPSEELGTISTALFRFKGPFGAHWENISAGAILVIVLTLIVFLLLQRWIYNGFARGATK
jgi:ABC-type Fe3+ transport system permease subunit